MKKKVLYGWCALFAACALLLTGCAAESAENRNVTPAPEVPENLARDGNGVPLLAVYHVDEDTVYEMSVEAYLAGVLAGEMRSDWPMEALKAQAILARTFVMKFCTDKKSKYEGADISTDVEEAQAYDATGVNERIEQAVKETEGLVLSNHGELPYAWFHAHSGGMTALAGEGLGWDKAEPDYTQNVPGEESEQAPEETAAWQILFAEKAFLQAAERCGVQAEKLESVSVGQRGPSGRATTILINGQSVDAAEMRLALGSTQMRSTLLESLRIENGGVRMAGKGYGHGVGMPQWGAYAMAEKGKTAEEIVTYYFRNVTVEKIW